MWYYIRYMQENIYEPFKVGIALGAELNAPAGVYVYIAKGLDYDGNVNFSGVYSSYEKAVEAMKSFALEQLELLDSDAPWMNMPYFEREKLSGIEYYQIFNRKLNAWLSNHSDEAIIATYWNPEEDPIMSDAWSIIKEQVK